MSTWQAEGTQTDFMMRDECITVDDDDRILGSANKFDCHRFTPQQPRGRLHRAFSVFLFDASGRLLLQQRAAHKITFPGVWTNTCCSHQLVGQTPDEVDALDDVAVGRAPGAAAAAVRKLQQELGVAPQQLPAAAFKFLTRLHYCAADEATHGASSPWGEHEIDYILLARADVLLAPNPEEVQATRYVTQPELAAMMQPSSGLSWSPWFRIIATHLLPAWWDDLDAALGSDRHVDGRSIQRLTC